MTLDEWMALVCAELDLQPVDSKAVLDLARDVAHGVDRPAAPLTCLLIGLAAGSSDASNVGASTLVATDLDAIIDRVRALIPGSYVT